MNIVIRFLFGLKDENDPGYPIRYKYKSIKDGSDKAWLVTFLDGSIKWLPKSRTTVKRKTNEIIIPRWLARAKRLCISKVEMSVVSPI